MTIPALREWSAGRGAFSLGPRSRIVVHPRHVAELRSTADLLADELEEVIGRRLPVVGRRRSRAGDIGLCLGSPDRALGREGYVMNVGTRLRISARTGAGVFYGTRTLLQLLRQGPEVQAGTARDWPRYPERGLMVANGESYTASFLTRQIAELAYLKLNYLHLHFGDYRWQVESERHPEVAADEGTCLTKEEVRRIVAVAERHHITVVPEIDMPGHMIAALAHHPELRLETPPASARRTSWTSPTRRPSTSRAS